MPSFPNSAWKGCHLALQQVNRTDQSLSRSQRLKSPKLLAEAFERGRKYAGRLMIMWIREGADSSLRLAVAAGRAAGGAVQRNRAKRRMREAFRLNRWRFRGKCDVVLVARGGLNRAAWEDLQAELVGLAGRAGILKSGNRENG